MIRWEQKAEGRVGWLSGEDYLGLGVECFPKDRDKPHSNLFLLVEEAAVGGCCCVVSLGPTLPS